MISLESNTALYFLAFLFFPLVFLAGIKFDNPSETMSKETTDYLRGIFAIVIVIGHFANHLSSPGLLKVYNPITGYAVSFFLGLSGFALESQLLHRSDYLVGFVKKRLLRIYIPWLTSLVFFTLLYQITDFLSFLEGALLFRTVYRENTFNWYIICTVYFYVCFYFCGKYIKEKHIREKVILAISILWTILCLAFKMPPHWYNNSLLFFVGVKLANNVDWVQSLAGKKTAWFNLLVCIGLFFLAAVGYCVAQILKKYAVLSWMIWDLGGVSFFCGVAYISLFVNLREGVIRKTITFVGAASLEVFFLATGIILKYYEIMHADTFSPIFALMCVASIVCLFHLLDRKLIKLF